MFTSLSRIYAINVPDGSLRAGQIVEFVAADDIGPGAWGRDALRSAGVPDAEIGGGSIAVARVFCCGGETEEWTAPVVYVPKDVTVALGDFVEIWSDHAVATNAPRDARPNRVTRVLQSADSPTTACSWQPDNPNLWMRVAYCSWMPAQGWRQQEGMLPFWVKTVGPMPPA